MVLFASFSGSLGGAERLLLDFAGAVDDEPALACPAGALADAARASGLRVFELRARGLGVRTTLRDRLLAPRRLAGHALEIDRLSRSLAPELLVAWGMRSAIACSLLRRPPCPVAFQHNDFLPGPLIGTLVRRAALRSDVVTAPSVAVAEDLDPRGRLGPRLKVVVPGVDVDRFAVGTAPANPPQVLVLGALTGWKRPDVALEACALARRARPDLCLRLVGAPMHQQDEQLVAWLRKRAAQPDLAGAVELVGWVADPRAELARATCLLHCAPREPFGIAVLEALAAGRPAIVPAAAGPAEIVDGSSGLQYPPGDARAAADAILEVLSSADRAAEIGAAGRARARQHFDRAAAQAGYAAAVGPLRRGREAQRASVVRPVGSGTLALLTVTHNSAGHLRRLLSSVERHLPGVRVVVVDCASDDESAGLARACDSAVCLALTENVGFGRACNRGLADVDEPVVALVNPDVELLDDSLLELASEALRSDRLLAPLVLSPDGSREDSVHPVPTSAADLARSLVPPAIVPRRLGLALAPWRAREPRRVGWAVGCALLARTDTLRRLGPFDERIFLYGEDLELGLRAGRSGVQTWFWPAARVLHSRAHATERAFGGEPFDLLASARHAAVARGLGPGRACLDDLSQTLTFSSRLALKRAIGRPATRERRQLAAVLRAWRRSGDAGPRR